MTKDKFTFMDYITNYKTENVEKFKTVFKDTYETIPNKMSSSKSIMNVLNITSGSQFFIFQRTYFEYFKFKML